MKNYAIVFVVIVMLIIVFTALVFAQKKENLHHGQMLIQEKNMEFEHGLRPNISENPDSEILKDEPRLILPKQLERREIKISNILSDTMYVLISIISETWDTITSEWCPGAKRTCTSDEKGNRTEELYQMWDSGEWVNAWKYSYNYDVSGNQTEMLVQSWIGSEWMNNYKYTYTYDGNGNLMEDLVQKWIGSEWVSGWKYTYTYDGNGNLTEDLHQVWRDSNWVNLWKYTYTYDGNENRTDGLFQFWIGGEWRNEYKYTYTYDGNGNPTEEVKQFWSSSSEWMFSEKHTYIYDANGKPTEELVHFWSSGEWVNGEKYTYTYDGNGNLTVELIQNWNSTAWLNNIKDTYTWQMLITNVNEPTNAIGSFTLSANYPNPFNPQTKISFSVSKESYITLKVYDLLGREVATLVNEKKQQGEYSVTWSAEGVPSGVYYYRLVAVDPSLHSGQVFIETKKMIVMK